MAVIKVNIVVAGLESVLELFTHIKVYRSVTGAAGPFVEVTAPASRPALTSDTIVYGFTDEAGDPDYWYRSSYYNPTSGQESSPGDAVLGEGDPALDILTVTELKQNYLFGLDLTDDQGNPFPDTLYEFFIRAAVSAVEHKLDLPLRRRTITDERHDFVREDYDKYIWLELDVYPVIDVESVSLVFPGDVTVRTYDRTWIHVQKDSGQLQIVPGPGSAGLALLSASGAWIPFIAQNIKTIPDAFKVTYTVGFEDGVPPDLVDIVAKTAAFGPLNIAGDLIAGAGIASQSLSIDGLSQSINTTSSATNSGYGARLLQYSREIKEMIPTLRRFYKGIGLKVV